MCQGRWQNIQQTEHIHLLWEWFQFTARKILIRSHYIILSFCSVLSLYTVFKIKTITDQYIGEVSTNYWQSVDKVSVNEKRYRPRHIWNDYRPCLDQVLSNYPTTVRPPCDFHFIKVIGHATFASAAVFLSFLHLSPHLHALEQQRDSWTQVQRRFTQHPPSREHPQYANCKHAADTSSRVINFGFRRPSL